MLLAQAKQQAPNPEQERAAAVAKVLSSSENREALAAADPDGKNNRLTTDRAKSDAPGAVAALAQALGLKGEGHGVVFEPTNLRRGPTSLDIWLIEKGTGNTTKVSFQDADRGKADSVAGVTISSDNDLADHTPVVARGRVAAQLSLDPAKVKIELSHQGKGFYQLSAEEKRSVKEVTAVVTGEDGKTVTHVFTRANGKLASEPEPKGGRDNTGLKFREKDDTLPKALVGFRELDLGTASPDHLRNQQTLAAKVGLRVLVHPDRSAEMSIHRVGPDSSPLVSKFEISDKDLKSGAWQSRLSSELAKQLGNYLIDYYKDKGIEEFLKTGKFSQTADKEFVTDFRTDLNQVLGLPKAATTELKSLLPDKGPLAGSTVVVLVNAEGIPVGSFRFLRDRDSGNFTTAQAVFSTELAPTVIPKK